MGAGMFRLQPEQKRSSKLLWQRVLQERGAAPAEHRHGFAGSVLCALAAFTEEAVWLLSH